MARVVSIENVSSFSKSSSMRFSINRPASIATLSGLNGERPLAISSALTNSLQSRISGSTVYDAVVFPAPLHPLMIYRFLSISGAKLLISKHITKQISSFFIPAFLRPLGSKCHPTGCRAIAAPYRATFSVGSVRDGFNAGIYNEQRKNDHFRTVP